MPVPTKQEFERSVFSHSPEELAEQHVFDEDVHIFGRNPDMLRLLRDHLSRRLPAQRLEITVVGSAKTGFSLDPNHYGVRYGAKSDLDIVVISDDLFDAMWHCFLKWHYHRRHSLPDDEWQVAKRWVQDLYWGWLRPDAIKYEELLFPRPLREARRLTTEWSSAFQSLSLVNEFAPLTVHARLYRSRQHAILYHASGIRQIREQLEKTGH